MTGILGLGTRRNPQMADVRTDHPNRDFATGVELSTAMSFDVGLLPESFPQFDSTYCFDTHTLTAKPLVKVSSSSNYFGGGQPINELNWSSLRDWIWAETAFCQSADEEAEDLAAVLNGRELEVEKTLLAIDGVLAEMTEDYMREEKKITSQFDNDPLLKLKSREVDLRAMENERKKQNDEAQQEIARARLLQSKDNFEDKLEQNEDLAKLRAGVSLAKSGVQQASVMMEDD
jgi:hypothetical protein